MKEWDGEVSQKNIDENHQIESRACRSEEFNLECSATIDELIKTIHSDIRQQTQSASLLPRSPRKKSSKKWRSQRKKSEYKVDGEDSHPSTSNQSDVFNDNLGSGNRRRNKSKYSS